MKNNDVLIWKGFKWSNLAKLDLFHVSYAAIQAVTLSRYAHTAILRRHKEKVYLYQALFEEGVHIKEVSEEWLETKILKNEVDVFRCEKNIDPNLDLKLHNAIKKMYEMGASFKKLGDYNFKVFFNMLAINVFNTSFIEVSEAPDKSICSELTHNAFYPRENCFDYSPATIATNDDRYKRVE